ncbi:H-NS family nucleoid-associated regulatory protein [Paracoccus sp. 22332]
MSRYSHPGNTNLTRSARGKKPGWIVEALEAGKSLNDSVI